MKTFLICPVRGHEMNETSYIVNKLESEGWEVYWPPRDTDQVDNSGYKICKENASAIKNADAIHIVWDGKSQGSLFDLGVAFAFDKKIIPIEMPEKTPHKSFQNMVEVWSKTT